MPHNFFDIAFTDAIKQLQSQHGSRAQYERLAQRTGDDQQLGPSEQHFISLRDSFYMASVSETGWPYIQHRGGPAGFVHTLNPGLLGFADLRGNKQYISVGNFVHDNRVALFFMDYPNQTRLKILGRVEVHETDSEAASWIAQLKTEDTDALSTSEPERAILIHVEGFDWNCPQHITPRYTEAEIATAFGPLQRRLKQLEAENQTLRDSLASKADNLT